jgi:hypothetical protein
MSFGMIHEPVQIAQQVTACHVSLFKNVVSQIKIKCMSLYNTHVSTLQESLRNAVETNSPFFLCFQV